MKKGGRERDSEGDLTEWEDGRMGGEWEEDGCGNKEEGGRREGRVKQRKKRERERERGEANKHFISRTREGREKRVGPPLQLENRRTDGGTEMSWGIEDDDDEGTKERAPAHAIWRMPSRTEWEDRQTGRARQPQAGRTSRATKAVFCSFVRTFVCSLVRSVLPSFARFASKENKRDARAWQKNETTTFFFSLFNGSY